MNKYCCFEHPELDERERLASDTCEQCGRAFNYILENYPDTICGFKVVRSLDRGFYSAAFLVEAPPFGRRRVLKVAPTVVYEKFKKDFTAECKDHFNAAEGSSHIVDIEDVLEGEELTFGKLNINCNVAVLDYVPGSNLSSLLAAQDPLSAKRVAQIAIDIFQILRQLNLKRIHHNDLHSNNLVVQELTESTRRADAEDELIRVVAIDLNSVADASKSDAGEKRLGDVHWAVQHIRALSKNLIDSDISSDSDYRLASVLEDLTQLLLPSAETIRPPSFEECVEIIRDGVRHATSPWSEPPRLRRFNDAYNAQTLAPWFVPYLIVDPDDKWISEISTPGPQVITGMRGCGKTMLLRSLQFHARATSKDALSTEDLLKRLKEDGYVGFYVSSTRLLEDVQNPDVFPNPYTRLLISFALEIVRAIRHLRELDTSAVDRRIFQSIWDVVAAHIAGLDSATEIESDYQLENLLVTSQIAASRGDETLIFNGNSSSAFPALASVVRKFSSVWQKAKVLFLLDDVSTRFLQAERIQELMSSLLFSDPICAFKLTTEEQTLELILQSPGLIESARSGRDYEVFNLGAEVNGVIRGKNGRKFVENVLKCRAEYFGSHPDSLSPAAILGDCSLKSIAERIGKTSRTSNQRKAVYYGMSALTGACVGDIGDAISIYELMLKKAETTFPISAKIQSEAFQEYCSRRMYGLNRKKTFLRLHATAFADASHQLLVQSYKDKESGITQRLRQYVKLYVRLTQGDTDEQFRVLLELIDAGIFVLDGGAHRTKTKDRDPTRQFKLTFRKMFGLSSFIGLAERDRFELSGDDLIEWLKNPKDGKEVLLRNLAKEGDYTDDPSESESEDDDISPDEVQTLMFTGPESSGAEESEQLPSSSFKDRIPNCVPLTSDQLAESGVDHVFLGLGFEERTLESVKRLLKLVEPKSATLVQYSHEGKTKEIRKLFESKNIKLTTKKYEDALIEIGAIGENVLVDVAGLAKPIVFHAVEKALTKNRKVFISHTRAKIYFPRDEDIAPVLLANASNDFGELQDGLRGLLTGETGPYEMLPLQQHNSDDSRRRMLCAFSSPRHERLLHLLDNRSYDKRLLFVHDADTPRAKLSKLTAEFAELNNPSTSLEEFSTNDIVGMINAIASAFHQSFVASGFNVELGLTGSKLQAVACAAIASSFRIAQTWYVQPKEFDTTRFSSGAADTSDYFQISR